MANFFLNDDSISVLTINRCFEKEPLLTVFVPTYQRVDTLKETIESIKNNHFDFPYQILVTDNSANFGKDNATKELLEQYEDLPIDYYINKENLGVEGNWNQGIILAKSKYVCFVHDDDLLTNDYGAYIKQIIAVLEKNKKCAYFKATYDFFSKVEDVKEEKQENQKKCLYKCTKTASLVNGDNQTYTPSCGMIFKKAAIIDIGGFDPSYYPSSDNEIGTRLFQKKYYGVASSWVMGHYRIGLNGSMKVETIRGFIEKDIIIRKNNYRYNIWSKLFSCLFEKYFYSSKIDFWINYSSQRFNKSISVSELDINNSYRHYKRRPFLLRVIGKLDACFCKKYRIK